ncbi:MAG: DJ-1/PfpI family protein, partial [Stackebrandtia sp.]
MTHSVAVLLFDDTSGFTAGMAAEVFGRPAPEPGLDWYELLMCAEAPGSVAALGGARFDTPHGLDAFATADTVIVPGVPGMTQAPSPAVVTAIRRAHHNGARLVSLCSGTFALAGAGVLDGRRAATHWAHAEELRQRHPLVDVDPEVLYIDDGDVLTSAGQAAGLDLCLHLVRKDHGAAIANRVARRLDVQPQREGGQAQFIET